jgi:hypothetical protein
MTESQFYQRVLKQYFQGLGFFISRVEMDRFPDIYLSKNNIVILCEIKVLPKIRSINVPKWRVGQLSWIEAQKVAGTFNVVLALNVEEKSFLLEPKKFYTEEELRCPKNYLEYLMNKTILT